MKITSRILFGALLIAGVLSAQDGPRGHWTGSIAIPDHPLAVEVDLDKTAAGWVGSIAIPAQNASGLPLEAIAFADGKWTFRIKAGPGQPTFTGTLSADGLTLSGDFTQGDASFPFQLSRAGRLRVPGHPAEDNAAGAGDSHELKRAVHHTIARVTADIERYSFNTAVAACMELSNTISRHARSGTDRAVIEESTDTLLELLAPFAPHLAAEAYERRHGDNVHTRPWPVADVRLLTEQKMTMVVQVSGKLKDRIEVERDISEKAATEMALASPRVQEALGGALPARVIAKPPRLVNIIP